MKRRLTIPLLGHTGSLALAHIRAYLTSFHTTRADNVFATCAGAYGGNVWAIANVPRVVYIRARIYNTRGHVAIDERDAPARNITASIAIIPLTRYVCRHMWPENRENKKLAQYSTRRFMSQETPPQNREIILAVVNQLN